MVHLMCHTKPAYYNLRSGKQVKDIIFIEDLLNTYLLAVDQIDIAAGQVCNVGGGRGNTLAIWSEFGPILERLSGHSIPVEFKNWRPGEQRVYTSISGKSIENWVGHLK